MRPAVMVGLIDPWMSQAAAWVESGRCSNNSKAIECLFIRSNVHRVSFYDTGSIGSSNSRLQGPIPAILAILAILASEPSACPDSHI